MEEVKRKEMELYQLKKKTAEFESKLKQQQVYIISQGRIVQSTSVYVYIRHCTRQCVQRETCVAKV